MTDDKKPCALIFDKPGAYPVKVTSLTVLDADNLPPGFAVNTPETWPRQPAAAPP
jgi:hypothetical protein